MSYAIGATDFGSLDQIVANTSQTKQLIAQLSAQASSGNIAPNYAGLGQAAAPALDLTAAIASNTALQTNADSAANIQQIAQNALGNIETITSNFATSALTLANTPTNTGTGVIAADAQDALRQVANLLDTKVGDIYVFAGQDSATPPVPDPNGIAGSAFFTAIQTAIAGLTTNGATATEASTLAIAAPGGISPFSPSLEAAGQQSQVDLGNGSRVTLAPLANANSNATSTGTSTTGSYTRDLLRSLATLGSLTAGQANDPNFLPLVQDTISSLNGAVSAISTDIGALGNRQNLVTTANTELGDTNNALTSQLSNLQDVDLTQVATKLSLAQTQLQASYQIISSLGTLSLAKFLPA